MNPALLALLAARVAAPTWTPMSLSGLFAWFDASDASTLTEGAAGRVSKWADKSGNYRDVSMATASYQPYRDTHTIGGLRALRWDASNWAPMASAAITLSQPYTVAHVSRIEDPDPSGTQVVAALGSGNCYVPYATGTQWAIYNGAALTRGTRDTLAHAFTGIHNDASSSIRLDGTQVGTVGAAGATKPGVIYIGGPMPTAHTASMRGEIGEMVIVAGAISGSDLTNMETYLKTKWGIA